MPVDHIGINVGPADYTTVRDWYEVALKPAGYVMRPTEEGEKGPVTGYSDNGKNCDWWVIAAKEAPNLTMHFAFLVHDRAKVDAFYKGAMDAGGRCNGPPGPRPQYHTHYYAAFVFDPIGNNVEVLCLDPPGESTGEQ